jgi:hypothetical protein
MAIERGKSSDVFRDTRTKKSPAFNVMAGLLCSNGQLRQIKP